MTPDRVVSSALLAGLVLTIFLYFLGKADALPECKKWPSSALYLATDSIFKCTGNITAVKLCRKEGWWLTVRTWIDDGKGLISDLQSSETIISSKNKFNKLSKEMEFKAGQKFGFNIYDLVSSHSLYSTRCKIPFRMTESDNDQCKKVEIVFKVSQNCYKKLQQVVKTNSSQVVSPKPSATRYIPLHKSPKPLAPPVFTHSNRHCTKSAQTYFYAFIVAAAFVAILIAVLILMSTCALCYGVRRSHSTLDKEELHHESPAHSRTERPGPVKPAPYGTYEMYSSAEQPRAKTGNVSYTEVQHGDIPSHYKTASPGEDLYETMQHSPLYPKLERTSVELQGRLGSELYCEMYKGKVDLGEQGPITATVKVVKAQGKGIGKHRTMQEAAILAKFDHPNVVKLFGVITSGKPLMVVTEYLPNGPLKVYLGKLKTSAGEDQQLEVLLLKFCQQIAEGMSYLSSRDFVHKELCARNVHLDEDLNCKITGFKDTDSEASSQDLYTATEGQIPIKWTAPEAILYNNFSTKSDVWSYGMVMYEIWSLGHKPFAKTTGDKVTEMVEAGYVHPPPPGCPRALYKTMIQCWDPQDTARPTFHDISALLNMDRSTLLQWTDEDREVSVKASVLGGDLKDGALLYKDLQGTYIHE